MPDDILLQIKRPGRYIGYEWNVSSGRFERSGTRFALCFPDMYEVGMSNLGVRIIYGLLNSLEGVCCERVFCPDTDMEAMIRGGQWRFLSLESQKELREFDILGFSVGHELSYTNVLNILDLAGIPLKAVERGSEDPLVIGGGPCALNPEPLYAFFDLFILGEAEEALPELLREYRRLRDEKASRRETLEQLSRIAGVYVPALYEVVYDKEGRVVKFAPHPDSGAPERIDKRFVADLEEVTYPQKWLVPNIGIVHDRIALELTRGCPNLCRFCQARSQYFPLRVRSPEKITDLACRMYQCTGYEDISLLGLSVSDYPRLGELLEGLVRIFKEKAVSISLPSLKPKAMLGGVSSLLASIKKTGLTFAPEAASEKLRRNIAKDFNDADFTAALEKAYANGYQHIKLYFLIGLPGEEDADLDGIIDFSLRASELRRKAGGAPAQVNISVNALIPKPHTPLQWLGMAGLDEIERKQDYLKKKAKSKRLRLTFHDRYMSVLEAVFSRGDRRLSEVILSAFLKGARFDAWGDKFNFFIWEEAFREQGIDYRDYLRQRPPQEPLPWDFLNTGVDRQHLLAEFNKVIAKQ